MASCNSFPTLTSTAQLVTNSLSTSTTSHVTTLPPTTTTITLTPTCTASSGTCTPVVTVSQIPGGISTIVDTVTITVPVTSSQVTTLWGSSCSPTNPDTPPPTPTPSDTSTPPPSPSFSTPPPSIFVMSSSSTAADGSVTPVILTVTSTVPPVLVSQTAPATATGSAGSDSSRSLGPIIGGVVGGVVGLCALIFLVWFFIRRRQRWDDIFDNDVPIADASTIKKEKFDSAPKPYEYGLVGHTKTSSLTSPPSSPPLGAATSLDGSMDRSHYRNNSATPLLSLPTGNAVHRPDTSSSARPPSSSSALGFGPQANSNTQGQVWDPRGFQNNPSQQHSPFPGSSAMGSVGPTATTIGRGDGDHRAGSPVSFQERRILQVTNADLYPQSPQSPENGSSFMASWSPTDPQRDGKGRIVPKGEKAPIVHLDGGRYQGGAAGSSSVASPAPPAYSE